MVKILGLTLLLTCWYLFAPAQEFANTLFLDSLSESPPATIDQVAWISGHWQGEAFGGIVEEVWSPPLGKAMMCAFKLVVDDQVRFYEIVTITEEKGSLMLRLKHFSHDLKGWEEKNETVDFPLVKLKDKVAYFDGFTFEKPDNDTLNIYVVTESKGKKSEMKFPYSRIKTGQ